MYFISACSQFTCINRANGHRRRRHHPKSAPNQIILHQKITLLRLPWSHQQNHTHKAKQNTDDVPLLNLLIQKFTRQKRHEQRPSHKQADTFGIASILIRNKHKQITEHAMQTPPKQIALALRMHIKHIFTVLDHKDVKRGC